MSMGLGISRAARFARYLVSPVPLVLLYHRVPSGDPGPDPFDLCVPVDVFERQMALLARVRTPMPLSELVSRTRQGDCPKNAVAVTFDDGYLDNLTEARPVLERLGIPASVFIASGYVEDASGGFWWEALTDLLLRPGVLPEVLEVRLPGEDEVLRIELGVAATYSLEEMWLDAWWRMTDRHAPTLRQVAFRTLYERLAPLDHHDRFEVLDRLWAQLDSPRNSDRESWPMTAEELRQLTASGTVTVGAHTVSHPFLPGLDADAQQREIVASRNTLSAILGEPVTQFAYPHGASDVLTRTLVDQAGFSLACSTRAMAISGSVDPFAVPRIPVANVPLRRFARRVIAAPR